MRCDWVRSALLRLGCIALLAGTVAGWARAQDEPNGPSAQQQQIEDNSIDRWNQMSPEERERELAKLPPARARMIRQRIQRYNQMNPEEQQALRERYQLFTQLSPEKRQDRPPAYSRTAARLTGPRQRVVHREIQQLRLLPPGQRQARMSSEEFRNQFSPQEQQIVRDLSTYLPR